MTSATEDQLSSIEVKELSARYTYGTWRRQKGWSPLHIVDANGCYFMDSDGKKYLDFSGQLIGKLQGFVQHRDCKVYLRSFDNQEAQN